MPSRLPFMKYWPTGGKTNFLEKILITDTSWATPEYARHISKWLFERLNEKPAPKLHTIREDAKGFWRDKVGDQVECFHWAGKPYRSGHDVFACLRIVSVQKFEIRTTKTGRIIEIDGAVLGPVLLRELAVNDGFENLDQFLDWFKKDFTGYILHFTEFRY